MTLSEFGSVFGVLALQLRLMDSDEPTMRAYYEALKHFDLGAIQGSAQKLARETDRRFFPTTAEWATAAARAEEQDYRNRLLPDRTKPWTHDCDVCEDTGWEYFACPAVHCGRKFEHNPHDYVKACPCRATNRTYQRHQRIGRTAGE